MRLFRYINKLKLEMNQILQAYDTRCISKPTCEITISLLMKLQDDQRCVIKMPIPWIISSPTSYVVMSNPLITQIKTKNWFVSFHVLSHKIFQLSLFVWLHFSNLFKFNCSFNFQILIKVIGNYENCTKNEDFYFGG